MGLLCTHRGILTTNLIPTLAYVKYFLTKSEKYPAMLPDTSILSACVLVLLADCKRSSLQLRSSHLYVAPAQIRLPILLFFASLP